MLVNKQGSLTQTNKHKNYFLRFFYKNKNFSQNRQINGCFFATIKNCIHSKFEGTILWVESNYLFVVDRVVDEKNIQID